MKVWAHTIVKNEERYIWFSIKSIINYVDKVLVYDTGSTDKTVELIKLVKKDFPDKIVLREVGGVDVNEFTSVRQRMLDETKAGWVWILDADEVWWDEAAKKHRALMGSKLDSIVVRYKNLIGDIYHTQGEPAGKYEIDGKRGHLTIRAMNMSLGLNVLKPHGAQGFFDKDGILIQDRDPKKRIHVEEASYLHFTHLPRAGSRAFDRKVPKRAMKYKKELGISLPLDFYYPEVFFVGRPETAPSPWVARSLRYEIGAALYTLPRMIKRKVWKGGSGY